MPRGKNKKVIGLVKDELVEKVMKEFVRFRAKTYSYLIVKMKKPTEGTKKCAVKRKLKFEDYKDCLKATQVEKKINYLEKIVLMWAIFLMWIKHNPDSEVKSIMFLLKKLIRLFGFQMMIK